MEEKKSGDAMPACDEGTVQSVRDMHPAHYILKIDSFSFLLQMLSEFGGESYNSKIFEASGHKWKLTLYPNGDKKRNGKGHISLYLSIEDTNNLSPGWDVYAEYKFFVFDQIRDKYLIFQDAGKKLKRFCETKKEWGFAQMLPLKVFDDASKGYLIQDKCVFGVEIFVCNYNGSGECLAKPEKLISRNSTYTWKVTNYSTLTSSKYYYSPVFTLGNCKWKILFYPKGNNVQEGKSVSVYLQLDDLNTTPRVYASYKLSIKDQNRANHKEYKGSHFFCATSPSWGWHGFLSLKDFEDAAKGFLVKDTFLVGVEITHISIVKSFS